MFLRKLTVMVLPLVALAILLSLTGWADTLGLWGEAGFSLVCGLALSLLPMVSGERRGQLPFARLLAIPAGLLLILLLLQVLTHEGGPILPVALQATNHQTILLEGITCGAMAGRAIRG